MSNHEQGDIYFIMKMHDRLFAHKIEKKKKKKQKKHTKLEKKRKRGKNRNR